MQLDVLTLMAAGSFVSGLGALLLLGMWAYDKRGLALLWWGLGHVAFGASVAVLALATVQLGSLGFGLGTALSALAAGLLWAGARSFSRRKVAVPVVAAGMLATTLVGTVATAPGVEPLAPLSLFLTWLAYLAATIWELWRGRGEPLPARWPMVAVLSLHAAVFALGIIDIAIGTFPMRGSLSLDSLFGVIHLEGLVYALGATVLMALLSKERSEREYLRAAETDSLTGIANRRALFDRAERLFERARIEGSPVSIGVFDLDRFKQINDTHGHLTGDRVITLFVEAARAALRPGDFVGRLGGEEFAVILPGAGVETAWAIADRVRRAFATAVRERSGLVIEATVSAGVAAADPEAGFPAAIEAADAALYRAKNHGRNRVERAESGAGRASDNVIRVA